MAARLQPITLKNPGGLGLQTQRSTDTSNPEACLVANNWIYDNNGRLAVRKGFSALSSAHTGTPNIEVVYEYEKDKDTTFVLSTATVSSNPSIFHGTTSFTDITGSLTPSANRWQFQNFNGVVVGAQQGEELIVWNGTGNFATIQSGLTAWQANTSYSIGDIVRATSGNTNLQFVVTTAGTSHATTEPTWSTTDQTTTTDNTVVWTTIVMPKGDACLAAFGRVWALSEDGQTLKYSGLLDHTDWGTTSAGLVDLSTYWGNPIDFGKALAAFNNLLVVFGHHSIITLTSPGDPSNLAVNDTLEDIGCISRDTVASIGDDLVFLDHTGVRSLLRSYELKSQPLREISINVRDDLIKNVRASTASEFRSAYDPIRGIYVLLTSDTTQWIFDVKQSVAQGAARITRWNMPVTSLYFSPIDNELYLGGSGGKMGKYDAYQDDGSGYTALYESTWADYDASIIKILKTFIMTVVGGSGYTPVVQWKTDFRENQDTYSITIASRTVAEWNIAEWGESEWSGADGTIRRLRAPMSRSGTFISIGLTVPVNGEAFALEEILMLIKQGRITR